MVKQSFQLFITECKRTIVIFHGSFFKNSLPIMDIITNYLRCPSCQLFSFPQIMSYFTTAQHEKERLEYFASPEGRDDLYQYNQKERRTVLEVLSGEVIGFFLSYTVILHHS